MDFRVSDRVIGTEKSWEHRVGDLGTVTVCKGDNIWVLWDGEETEHFVFKDEILKLKEKPMRNEDTPTLWCDMTRAEKGELLLAKYEKKAIESYEMGSWNVVIGTINIFYHGTAYRIKPKPKRETLKLYGKNGWYDPAIGTIDLIDGKPDLSSLKMWKI